MIFLMHRCEVFSFSFVEEHVLENDRETAATEGAGQDFHGWGGL